MTADNQIIELVGGPFDGLLVFCCNGEFRGGVQQFENGEQLETYALDGQGKAVWLPMIVHR